MLNPFELINKQNEDIKNILQQILHTVQPRKQEDMTLLTRKEAAMVLRISLPTLDRLLKVEKSLRLRVEGRVFVKKKELNAYLSKTKTR